MLRRLTRIEELKAALSPAWLIDIGLGGRDCRMAFAIPVETKAGYIVTERSLGEAEVFRCFFF